METIGALEATTRLTALLDRVANGESITITRDGVPAAKLVPVTEPDHRLTHKEIMAAMRALRAQVKPDVMSVREMVEEWRRS